MGFYNATLTKCGFLRCPSLLETTVCGVIAAAFDEPHGAGIRHLIDHPSVIYAIRQSSVAELVHEVLGGSAFAYKATLFDKHTEANWLVAWHQDLSIPVQRRLDLDNWTGWSCKDHVLYVQPPTEVLSKLVALRINLDDCNVDSGPLRLLEGSHRLGKLLHREISHYLGNHVEQTVTGLCGDGLLMRPLLIHASSKAAVKARRRMLHLEFANFDLPDGMDWHRRVALSG